MKRFLIVLAALFVPSAAAQAPGPNEARLNWDYPYPGVEIWAFVIERQAAACSVSGTWAVVDGNLAGANRTYLDTNLAPGDYCWRVMARNSFGTSVPSNTAGKTIGAPPPPPSQTPPPTNLTVQ